MGHLMRRSIMIEKSEWMCRFAVHLMNLQPLERHANLTQIAETFWYYIRHRVPEEAAQARAAGTLSAPDRQGGWTAACSQAIRRLDPQLGDHDADSLAQRLWDADWVRAVDPYVMADALWDQATLLSLELNGHAKRPINPDTVFRKG
jgi:hypothetical protein